MAVVRETICASGVRVIIRDDCYRDCTPEEIERRRAEVWRVICQVNANTARAKALAEEAAARGVAPPEGKR